MRTLDLDINHRGSYSARILAIRNEQQREGGRRLTWTPPSKSALFAASLYLLSAARLLVLVHHQTLPPSLSLLRRTHILASLHYSFQPHSFTYFVMSPSHHLTLALAISCISFTAFALPAGSPVDQATQRAGVTHTHAGAGANIPPQVKAAAKQLGARVRASCPCARRRV